MSGFIDAVRGFESSGSVGSAIALGLAVLVGVLAHAIVFWMLERFVGRTESKWDDLLPLHLKGPSRLAAVVLAFKFVQPALEFPNAVDRILEHALDIVFIVCVSWLLIRVTSLLRDILFLRFDITQTDNLRSRKVHTQVKVLRNVLIVIVGVVAAAMVLMTFPGIRRVGVSLLASAGVAGIILGLAAQKTIANLLAGLQLAITQPISIDDVVIVEGEWG